MRYSDVRFKNQGLDLIEVQDNGAGISPANYTAVALKHCTSKLSTYADIGSLETFGFRGEALSSLCALSSMTITTCLESQMPKGAKLTFSRSGELQDTVVVAAQKGTIVSVADLFHNLPVRRRELERNIKREWNKVIALLNQYACIQTNLKFTVSQQPTKGKRIVLFSTKGNPTTRENIINIFGAKAMTALLPLDLNLEMQPTALGLAMQATVTSQEISRTVRIIGHVSRPVNGEGRQTPDRQMFFVNGRPCGLPQFARTFNEVYRAYNINQSPFILADIRLDTHLYDVNVSPDKRSILLHDQNHMLDVMRVSLISLFDSHEYTVPTSQLLKPTQATSQARSRLSAKNPQSATVEPIPIDNDSPCQASLPTKKDSHYGALSSQNEPTQDDPASETQNLLDRWVQRAQVKSPVLQATKKTTLVDVHEHQEESGEEDLYAATQPSSEISEPVGEPNSVDQQETKLHGEPSSQGFNDWIANAPSPPQSPASSSQKAITQLPPAGQPAMKALTPQKRRSDALGGSLPVRRSPAGHFRPNKISVTIGTQDRSPSMGSVEDDDGIGSPIENKLTELFQLSKFAAPGGDLLNQEMVQSPKGHASSEGRSLGYPAEQEASLFIEHEEDISDSNDSSNRAPSTVAPELELDAHNGIARKDTFTVKSQPSFPQASMRRKDTTLRLLHNIQIDEASIESSLASWMAHSVPRRSEGLFEGGVEDIGALNAETKLALIISKSDFGRMRIAGQFNKGFIIAVRPAKQGKYGDAENDELFIIDQHASDEKYNFERLQDCTVLQSQRLVHPKQLELTALEEEIVLQNMQAIEANGFNIRMDTDGDRPVGLRCQLMALPLSRETTFDVHDLEELVSLLGEKGTESSHVPRPSKVRKMFAMRACRSSIMIGKALTRNQMGTLVSHMGELNKPWNCPHGRPTMRHLCSLQTWDGETWQKDRGAEVLETWNNYMNE